MATLLDVIKPSPKTALVIPANQAANQPRLSLSYAQLKQQIEIVAANLYAALPSFQPNQAVAISLINGFQFTASFLAVTWMRGIAAPLNPAYTLNENIFYLDDMKCAALIVQKGAGQIAREAAKKRNIPIIEISMQWNLPSQTSQSASPYLVLSVNGKAIQPTARPLKPLPTDVCLILHTSGTTSRPKAVPLTHLNIVTSMGNISRTYELSEKDKTLVVMPLFHVHGLIGALLSTYATNGQCVIPPRFSAKQFWPTFDEEQCTWYSAVPTIHQILVAQEYAHNPKPSSPVKKRPYLRFIRSCSSALAPATFHALEALYGVPVLEAYAMTEAAHQMTSNNLPHRGLRLPGSVGQGQGVQVAALDDQNRVLPVGETGEISIKGKNVTPGYLNNPEANKACFTDGWFRTGDQGYLDKDGYVFLTGRLKELINRGGEKISPLEIDQVILSHPLVAEAIAFPIPDVKYGQIVHAAVVLKGKTSQSQAEIEKELQAFCRTKMAAFKVPEKIHFADTLPRTATGKIQRRHVATAFVKPDAAPRSKL